MTPISLIRDQLEMLEAKNLGVRFAWSSNKNCWMCVISRKHDEKCIARADGGDERQALTAAIANLDMANMDDAPNAPETQSLKAKIRELEEKVSSQQAKPASVSSNPSRLGLRPS